MAFWDVRAHLPHAYKQISYRLWRMVILALKKRKVCEFAGHNAKYERERMRRGQPKKVLPVGKLPLEHLRLLLRHLPKHDPRLIVGPQIGEDAAVISPSPG
jgi:hypothetical protein